MSFRGRPQASTSRLPEAPPVVSTARKLRKRPSSKGKERAPAAEATVEEKGDSADEWKPPSDDEQHRRNKGKRKASAKRAGKRVRIASPSSDDSDQQQEDFVSLSPSPTATGRRRLRGADESSDDDGELNPDHYWDPRVLPMNGAQRRTRELRKLEYGLYRSALYDAATNETDLGRILLEWEALKRRRRVEEQEQQEQEQGPGGTRVEQLARARRSTRSQSGTPAPLTDREDTPSTPFASLDDPDTLPFPSAFSLDLLSRWPLNPATLDTPSTITQPISDSLWSLVSSTAHQLERLNPALRPPPRRRARVRSAYETNAPLALPSTLAYTGAPTTNGSAGGHDDLEDSESSSDSDDLGSGDDDLDSLAPTPAQTSTFGHLSTSLDSLLMSLVDKIPAGPPPPLDFYTQQKIKASQPRERVLGWETVLEVVKGMEGVPESIAEQLEQRLVSVFGPPRPTAPSDDANDLEDPASPPPQATDGQVPLAKGRKKRAKSAPTTSAKGKGKRGTEEGAEGGGPRKRAKRGKGRSQASSPVSAAFIDDSDVDMPAIEEELPPLPELPPLSVLEEYRRGIYASSSAASEP